MAAAPAQDDRKAVMERELPKLKDAYRATALKPLGPETPLAREYYRLLTRYVRYAQPEMRDWPKEPGAKFHKVDDSKELAVRQNATVALAFTVLAECGDFNAKLAGATREQVRADAAALLRYLAVTHKANFLPTGDGKPWGDHWQSAFWAGIAGQAAWLTWGRLDDESRVMVARMVIHEADRFNTRPPDDGEWRDTKAEENAWNSEVIALARCMFQRHPNAALWHERAIVYMMNAFSTKADHEDTTLVDGRRVRDWVTTTCIHPDFTLENHNRVHPDYLSCFNLNLRNAVLYRLGAVETPRGMFHHAADCFGVLQRLVACNGSLFYVNGQDWWPHRHDVPLMIGGLCSTLMKDRNAAFIERATLEWLKRMHSRFNDGRCFDPREYNYRNAEEEMMARYAELYLLHRLFGDGLRPATRGEFLRAQSGVRLFDTGGFVTHRTPAKFASFAWVNGAMGLVYPSDDTWFISPDESSLTGRIEVEGVKDTRPKLEAHTARAWKLAPPNKWGELPSSPVSVTRLEDSDGFAFVGTFARCDGKIEQQLAMVSLPDAPVVYVERLRARADVKVKSINTGVIAILNEDAKPIVPNQRRVWTVSGEHVMRGAADEPAKLHVWDTPWANLDDKLGVVARASGRMTYNENHAYARSRLQQELVANHLADVGLRKAGEIISDAVIGLLPNARHTERQTLQVERLGRDGFGIRFRGWVVAINFGAGELKAQAFGREFVLAPLTAGVHKGAD